ncbi:hypothetical protein V5799_009725 [Amblyomma americanum]|uniref:Uncharacterized protein n=1 Tax=Amblyomma americanum TaxID=6943 RepID=A0AAQ4F9K8_AMBAM
MTSGYAPPTMPLCSDRCAAGDMSKKSFVTQDAELQRKERSFHECLEYLMPIYLLPLLVGDKTEVLVPSLLFAIAIVGDETTVFFRLCLFALERYALRMQPLFLYMQSLVLALSLILPSTIIMIFGTVFIDRFVSTVHDEVPGINQRMQSFSSTQNYCYESRRPRSGGRKGSSYITFGRRARSVSLASETTMASEVSAGSSVVKHYRMFASSPLVPKFGAPGTDDTVKRPRKTSFGTVERSTLDEDRPYYLPVRRIRSFSVEPSQPSSILKRSPVLPTTTPPCPAPSSSRLPPSRAMAGIERRRRSTFPMGGFFAEPEQGLPGNGEGQETPGDVPVSAPQAASSAGVPAGPTSPCSLETSPEVIESCALDASPPAEFWTPLTSPPPSPGTAASSPSPSAKSSNSGRRSGSPSPRMSRLKSAAKRRRGQQRNSQAHLAPAQQALESRNKRQAATEPPHVEQSSRRSSSATVRESTRMSRCNTKTLPDTKPEIRLVPTIAPKPVLKLGSRAESRSEPVQEQEPEARQEVRGVLKKRKTSLQPSLGSRSGSVPNWNLQSHTPLVNATEPQSAVPTLSRLNDSKTPLEKASSFCKQTSPSRILLESIPYPLVT